MFKNLDPQDKSIKPFKANKNFTFTNNDSGSGVFGVKARSGSQYNYSSASDAITSITSGSVTTNYYGLPTWHMLNQTFYADHITGSMNPGVTNRELNLSASIISVPRDLFGEDFELEEVNISDYVVNTLRDIKRSKSARNLKLKGGSVKVDMNTANMMLQVLDKINPMNKKKIMDILDKGTKNDFMKVHGAVMKAIR